jgi:hypothetical protein
MTSTVHISIVCRDDGLITVYKREDMTLFPLVDDGDLAYTGSDLGVAYHAVERLVARAQPRQARWRSLFGH